MSEAKAAGTPSFPALVQQFFTDYLLAQRAMSPNTVASYRDAMLLFLDFAHKRLGKTPTQLRLADIEPDLILAFLDDLQRQRNNSVRSRNLRLTALRAFLKFARRRDVASLLAIIRRWPGAHRLPNCARPPPRTEAPASETTVSIQSTFKTDTAKA